ncbi:unnamed protein product [Brassica rapa]|uniref:Uncharacterized protein n=1 Tax=Brassica campestris TaxID=3711 RepID=A0A8D9FXV4_BRACM|nr:unnamed protein product [Brassica rapa]
MVKKIFHHSRKETRPNTVLEPIKPTTDPRFEESNQSSTINPRTTNMESQIETTGSRKLSWRRRCKGITVSQNRT